MRAKNQRVKIKVRGPPGVPYKCFADVNLVFKIRRITCVANCPFIASLALGKWYEFFNRKSNSIRIFLT